MTIAIKESSPLLTTEQAAALLGMKPKTLIKWRFDKSVALPYVHFGRSVRYKQSDVDKFVAANTVKPKA
jgi:excisionase family DNA binding protein